MASVAVDPRRVAERLRLAALAAYQRLFGLELKQLVHLLSGHRPAGERAAAQRGPAEP